MINPPRRVTGQAAAASSAARAAKLPRAANRKPAGIQDTAVADTPPDTGICDDGHQWHRAVEESLDWLMSERVQFGPVDNPSEVARTYATQIAGTLEIEREPLEDLLSEIVSIRGPRTAAWLLERIDAVEMDGY